MTGAQRQVCTLAVTRRCRLVWVGRLAVLFSCAALALCAAAPAGAAVSFSRAWGWGVADGQSHLETCTTICHAGLYGGGTGELHNAYGVAVGPSGDVYVADTANDRIDEFSPAGGFIGAWGWGVADGQSRFEDCSSSCQPGIPGGGAGQMSSPEDVATDSSGNVYVADYAENRIDEFTATGAFVKAWGWGVADGSATLETCTDVCQQGLAGFAAGEMYSPNALAVDAAGDVYVSDFNGVRIDEFTTAGTFIRAWGWGVADGKQQLETCDVTSGCRQGITGSGAGQFYDPEGVATDAAGDVFVADYYNHRIQEFTAAGAFVKAWGWGVADGQSRLETCTTICQAGIYGGGAGQFEGGFEVATDQAGNVYVVDNTAARIDEFSATGAFVKAWGWGVADGQKQFETCTTSCEQGITGIGAGQLDEPEALAVDGAGDVYVADTNAQRIDEFANPSTLSVSLAGTGSGTVTSTPAGISCPTSCSHDYPPGTQVTLTAVPGTGSAFSGWAGACAGTSACVVTLGSDQALSATFTAVGSPSTGSPPSGSPPGGSTPAGSTAPAAAAGTPQQVGHAVRLTVHCTGATGSSCDVSVRLTVAERLRGRQVIVVAAAARVRTRTVLIGSATVVIEAGASRSVSVRLNRTGLSLLRRFRRLPARIQVAQTRDRHSHIILRRRLTLSAAKAGSAPHATRHGAQSRKMRRTPPRRRPLWPGLAAQGLRSAA
ncbi:MAG TPA: hypothetical protein VKV27_02345 [Solirubrobacteraceae bacterium]|nr:hypothetical protein [Solirubrobacteraceae bacterium]